MPEQCMAIMKPLGATHTYRCPVPVLPGEVYCPLHLVIEKRMKERARKHRSLLDYYKNRGWQKE